jgi:mRNA interferase RelE/StbE
VKTVRFSVSAARDFKRYGNAATRARHAIEEYAADGVAHANNVTQLVGSSAWRMRIVDFRLIFEQTATEIIVTKLAPRGSVYD